MTVYSKRLFIFCALALISIHGIVHLPIHPSFEFKGLDFQNIFAYSKNCFEWPVPYGKGGQECGDVLNRPFLYPPLLYYTMTFWPKFFSFHQAAYIWESLILIFVSFGSLILWSLEKKKKLMTLLGFGFLFAQLPMFYALERGNNDAVVCVLWALATYVYVKKEQPFWSGILLGVATAFKVYPVFGCMGVGLALLFARDWRNFNRLALGSVSGFLMFFLLLYPSSWIYFSQVAIQYSGDHSIASYFGHSLFRGADSLFIKFPLLFLLSWGFSKRMKTDALLCFAFFMTYGTFIPNTANDYSLVTAMPLGLILLHRALRTETKQFEWVFFLVFIFAFFGDRTPFAWIRFSKGHQLLFIAVFLALPLLIVKRNSFRPDSIDERDWALE